MLEAIRVAVQLVTLVIGVVTLATCITHLKSGGYILSVAIVYSSHLATFCAYWLWNVLHGLPNPALISDWSLCLRLHTAITVFVLSAHIIIRKNGNSGK